MKTNTKLTLCISLWLLLTPVAEAQYRLTRQSFSEQSFTDSTSVQIQPLKSPRKALLLSTLHTAVPISIGYASAAVMDPNLFENDPAWIIIGASFMYGTVFGPSVGNLYAKDKPIGFAGILIRTGSLISLTSHDNDIATAIGLVGLAGSTVYNIASAPASARKYNKRYGQAYKLTLAPTVDHVTNTPVMTLKLRF